MKALIFALVLALVAGCATTSKPDAQTLMQADLLDQAKAAAATPLFKLTCPATGCIIASLEVANPAAAGQMAEVARVAFAPQTSPALQAFIATLDTVKTLGGVGLIAHGVQGIMSSVVRGQVDTAGAGFAAATQTATAGFASNAAIAHLIPQPGAVTNYTLSGSGVIGAGTQTTTTTTSTNTSSNNRTCQSGTAGQGGGTTAGGAGGGSGPATC